MSGNFYQNTDNQHEAYKQLNTPAASSNCVLPRLVENHWSSKQGAFGIPSTQASNTLRSSRSFACGADDDLDLNPHKAIWQSLSSAYCETA
jgi:hypothetical protein